MHNPNEMDEKQYFLDTLRSTGRNGVESVIAGLEELGFFTAPASSNFHLNVEGGLLLHSNNVCREALALSYTREQGQTVGTYAVTRADVTRDLRWAKVYVSVLEDDKADDMIKALKKAAGYIRHELGLRVDLRYTPELLFERDRNIAYGAHIAQVLKEVVPAEEQQDDEA